MACAHAGDHEAAVKHLEAAVILCPHEASFETELSKAKKAQAKALRMKQEASAEKKCAEATAVWQKGATNDAIQLWQSALSEYGVLKHRLGQAAVHRRLGECHRHLAMLAYDGKSENEIKERRRCRKSAIHHFEAALGALRCIPSGRDVPLGQEAFLCLDLSRSLFEMEPSDYHQAKARLDEASDIARTTFGSEIEKLSHFEAESESLRGDLLLAMGSTIRSIDGEQHNSISGPEDAYRKAARAAESAGKSKEAAEAMERVAKALATGTASRGKDVPGAVEALEKAVASATKAQEREAECRLLTSLSTCLAEVEEWRRALDAARRAEKVAQSLGGLLLCRAQLNLAGLCGHTGQWSEGASHAQKATMSAKALPNLELEAAASDLRGNLLLAVIRGSRDDPDLGSNSEALRWAKDSFQAAVSAWGRVGNWEATRASEVMLKECCTLAISDDAKCEEGEQQVSKLGDFDGVDDGLVSRKNKIGQNKLDQKGGSVSPKDLEEIRSVVAHMRDEIQELRQFRSQVTRRAKSASRNAFWLRSCLVVSLLAMTVAAAYLHRNHLASAFGAKLAWQRGVR